MPLPIKKGGKEGEQGGEGSREGGRIKGGREDQGREDKLTR